MIDPTHDAPSQGGFGHRRRRLFRQRKIPVRYLVPNFFTLLSLCAGVTAIRMAIESRYEFAMALIVAAALLDGVDGRLARALKAQSRFGAELDSLADFVNFGVAPAIIIFHWALGDLKGFGWLAVLVFACGMGLRLARFNSMLDVDKPKWQSNYFTGIPAPFGAITIFLPFYLTSLGLIDAKNWPLAVSIYTLALAGMLVSTIPTFSGKLLGERISREWVLPVLVGAALLVGLLFTYPYATLAVVTLIYLGLIPLSYLRFQRKKAEWDAMYPEAGEAASTPTPTGAPTPTTSPTPPRIVPPGETKH
ncbi:MAG: CDP-alcohol phosphatidyltransferase family protein [Hyphomicrobiaceae bacterium]